LLLSWKTRHLNPNPPNASANLRHGMSKEFELALGKLELCLWTAAARVRFRGLFSAKLGRASADDADWIGSSRAFDSDRPGLPRFFRIGLNFAGSEK
jgi:hypothetical protein